MNSPIEGMMINKDIMRNEHSVMHHRYDVEIAGLGMEISMPQQYDFFACLPSFSGFTVGGNKSIDTVMEVKLLDEDMPDILGESRILTDKSLTWDNFFSLEEFETGYLVSIAADKEKGTWYMWANHDFSRLTIYPVREELYDTSVFSWLLMMAYGQAILKRNSVMLHASVVEIDGEAYAFLGKSGTGKSTHSQLWLKNIKGAHLLNDDNPVLRLDHQGRVRIYGTPWSGKTLCYINKGADLKAVVRLRQGKTNRLHWLCGVEALTAFIPSCTAMRWNRDLFNKMIGTVEKTLLRVRLGKFDCLPNAHAAIICYEEITNYLNRDRSEAMGYKCVKFEER